MVVKKVLEQIAFDAAHGGVVFSTHGEVALRVQKSIDDPDCSIDKLSRLIGAEPMLSARVVAIANSVAYRRSGRATADVKSAVARIGFRTVRALAAAIIVRQLEGTTSKEHHAIAAELWQHTAHVAALARVIAQRVVKKDPETAFFAGIVHEAGAFYLLSRAKSFPELFEPGGLADWDDDGEAQVGNAVLRVLGVPQEVLDAAAALWKGYLAYPPASFGDVLLLAEQLAPVESPLSRIAGKGHQGNPVKIDVDLDNETLSGILAESQSDVDSLVEALNI